MLLLVGLGNPGTKYAGNRHNIGFMAVEAIARGDIQAVNYFVAQKYVDALKEIASAPNQKVIMMPLEASSVIGSLGGLAQIAGEAFGGGAPPGPLKPAPKGRAGTVPQV
ncbi:MAG: hypothetical protein HC774_01440 [Sphingomonadales bacterium]|nr:hypothetical protein [Sphingomonadales bacterium]